MIYRVILNESSGINLTDLYRSAMKMVKTAMEYVEFLPDIDSEELHELLIFERDNSIEGNLQRMNLTNPHPYQFIFPVYFPSMFWEIFYEFINRCRLFMQKINLEYKPADHTVNVIWNNGQLKRVLSDEQILIYRVVAECKEFKECLQIFTDDIFDNKK